MKLNWKTFKILFAVIILVGVTFWAVNSLRQRSYTGENLNFAVGTGPVTVTNPSENPVIVQLVGSGTRSFLVLSTIDGVSGSSIRQGSGSASTQVFEFVLPPGTHQFTLTRATNASFVADTNTNLTAVVEPTNADESKTTLIVSVIVIAGALFYISYATKHHWLSVIRGRTTDSTQDTKPSIAITLDGGQGTAARTYGDNRADISH